LGESNDGEYEDELQAALHQSHEEHEFRQRAGARYKRDGGFEPPAKGHLEGHLIGCWEGVQYKYLSVFKTTVLVKPLDQGNT
jgi:hypothetical protein